MSNNNQHSNHNSNQHNNSNLLILPNSSLSLPAFLMCHLKTTNCLDRLINYSKT